ncbi:hypothetical protein DCAR_0622752 [Daucus carota subsp. sativus]|uniref:DNA polymerase epsilon subunit n=1 Tax=Daucus carota subsp. sativus TaxID=79200 RepID=A0AAF0X8V2_DAUCS|nr:hypothetical protein DCAR_0622667 [Daucus carota subsp. sativus]WOH03355.1 hypothetical protein DCAR_0622752 [Daucus carota subsp. sativus]
MSAAMRKLIQKKFKMRGYTLKVEALNEILPFLSKFKDAEDEALDLLLDELQHQSLKSSILDKESVSRVVSLLLEAEAAAEDTPASTSATGALRIIDAFIVPKYRYDPIKKIFLEHTGRLPIHGDASAKATLYRDRFLLLFQRLSRDPHFSRPAFDTDLSQFGNCQISPIQSLVGRTGKCWVMGVISQLEDGHFYLEDLTAAVEINLSNAISLPANDFLFPITTGFFSENTIVLAEGEMLLDGMFQVKTCGFPPLEDREKSSGLFSGIDFFGSGKLAKEETLRLAELETRAVNDMFVILSDIWLDNEDTMKNLQTVLDGYENVEVVPSLFVFMGNFCSHPCNLSFSSYSTVRMQFEKLGQIIAAHNRLLEHSRFLFIPGPDDAGPSTVLPRCPLPNYLTEELQKHVPNAVFGSNPCRIKFYTQEIVFFRQDLLYRMRRSCLMPPSSEETSDPFEHLVATITHQSHLCPLPLSKQPVIWNYDHCLHLYPTPHTIVLGDKSEQKAFNYTGITCFNPGSFSNDSTFVAYRPCTREVELSSL